MTRKTVEISSYRNEDHNVISRTTGMQSRYSRSVMEDSQYRKPFDDHGPTNTPTSQVQERAFTHWCNLFLKTKHFEIDSILGLQDGVYVIILLEVLTGQNLYESEVESNESEATLNWKVIANHFEDEGIEIDEYPDKVSDDSKKTEIITNIIWQIILRYQIFDESTSMSPIDYERAARTLMKWVRSKIPNGSIENFTTDWMDGVALCHLVNAIRTDTIPESMFQSADHPEMTVRLACTTAEDELGIPELIAPYDIANGKADAKSMMTYIAIFRSADRMIRKGIKTRTYTSDVSMSESENESGHKKKSKSYPKYPGISYDSPRCVAFGAGLRWGQVGRPTDFIVRLNGAQASDLSVSIECRPYDHRIALYKPELQIKPIADSSYIVRYTPTRPGEYVLSIFCGGDHIPASPFRLSVRETVLMSHSLMDEELNISLDPANPPLTTKVLSESLELGGTLEKRDSAFIDDDNLSSSEENAPPPWLDGNSHELYHKLGKLMKPIDSKISACGQGLCCGEVGVVSSFNVSTPNTDKGPLSVCITCPAMSIPVPCVKTKLHPKSLVHDVLYTPTEPGVYEIDVLWNEKPIKGSPFRLSVGDASEGLEEKPLDNCNLKKLRKYQQQNKGEIKIYYSATSANLIENYYKEQLYKLLKQERLAAVVLTVPIDLELTCEERSEIFEHARTKQLPLVFVNNKFFADYNQVMFLHKQGDLQRRMESKRFGLCELITEL